MQGYDFQEPYLRAIFGFIGITDIHFIIARTDGYGTRNSTSKKSKKLTMLQSNLQAIPCLEICLLEMEHILIAFDKDYFERVLLSSCGRRKSHERRAISLWRYGSMDKFSWVPEWMAHSRKTISTTSLVTQCRVAQRFFENSIHANDLVDFHENIFLKKITRRKFVR